MFTGEISGEKFLLFHNHESVIVQTLEDYGSFERIRKRLALILVRAFFVEHLCDYLARLKASHLCQYALAQGSQIPKFATEEACLLER